MKPKSFRKIFSLFFAFIGIGLALGSCSDSDDHQPTGDANILSFAINGNEGIIDEATGNIVVYLPVGTDITQVTPTVLTSTDASVTPDVNDEIDFSTPVEFTVTSKDKSKSKVYNVTVRNQETQIEKMEITYNNIKYNGVIDNTNNTVIFFFPTSVLDFSNLKPQITIFDGATINGPGEYINLSEGREAVYTIEYKGYKNIYRISAEYAAAPQITKFAAGGIEGLIDQNARTITMSFGMGADIASLVPQIGFSNESTSVVAPEGYQNGVDFTKQDLKFEIYSDIGGATTYSIVVKYDLQITRFAIDIADHTYDGLIDQNANTIVVSVPYSTDISSLKATVTSNTAGVTLSPQSGTNVNFSAPVTYTITHGTTSKLYTVTVNKVTEKIGFLGVWATASAIANGDEINAYNWFAANIPNGEYISFTDIKNGKDLSFYKVIWWHNDEYMKLPAISTEVADKLKAYHASGHSLLLTTFATQYIKELGVPKDGKAPASVGKNSEPKTYPYGWGISVNGYETHPIFAGLDIWDFGDGIKRFYLVGDNTWRMEKAAIWPIGGALYPTVDAWRTATGGLDLGGAEWEANRANMVSMAEFPKNNKGAGEGAVICIGLAAYDWKVDHEGQSDYVPNSFQDRIEALTRSTINYLSAQ